MKSGMFTWLFSTRHSLGVREFLFSILLLYAFSILFYDVYFLFLVLFPFNPLSLAILAYGFPLIILCMGFCVFIQRLNAITTKKRFLLSLFGIGALLKYLDSVGVDITGGDLIAWAGTGQTSFPILFSVIGLVITVMTGLLWMATFFGLAVYCISKKPAENTEGLKPVFISSILVLVAVFLVDFSTGFEGPYYKKFVPYHRILKIAERNDLAAERALADSYAKGIGLKKDLNSAIDWYESAFKGGDIDSAYYAGLAYDEIGDAGKAREWYEKAADKGSEWARQKIGEIPVEPSVELTKHDILVCQESSFDAEKCRELAIAGNANAQFDYAEHLEEKINLEVSVPRANVSFWYEQAALGGNDRAKLQIADNYHRGRFHRIDLVKASYWYEELVKSGDSFFAPQVMILHFLNRD